MRAPRATPLSPTLFPRRSRSRVFPYARALAPVRAGARALAGADAYVVGAVVGHLGDLVLGDPQRGHPVAAFGHAASAAERALWRDHRGVGAAYAALCVGGAVALTACLRHAARGADARPARERVADGRLTGLLAGRHHDARTGPVSAAEGPVAGALSACVTWTVLGGTGLARAAAEVQTALETGDVAGARRLLPRLCGRDPEALDAEGIARAVVESVAENTSDAVVGALVWGALAGAPGMAGFRAVNTLDAMVGHRSPRHLRFGWAAARADDLAGWPGARLTAALAALAGPRPREAVRVWRGDAARHPSPNAGPVEAAFAGALGVRLGGTLAYGGRVEHRPVLNAEGRAVRVGDIARAVRLSRRVGWLALLTTTGARTAVRTATRTAARKAARTAAGAAAGAAAVKGDGRTRRGTW